MPKDMPHRARLGPEVGVVAVHGHERAAGGQRGIARDRGLRAVAMVHVPVEHEHAPRARSGASERRGHRHLRARASATDTTDSTL